MEITQLKWQEENRIKKNEYSLRYLWENVKETNIHVIGIPDGEEKKKGIENLFEEWLMAENSPTIQVMETDIQAQTRETQRDPHTKMHYNNKKKKVRCWKEYKKQKEKETNYI